METLVAMKATAEKNPDAAFRRHPDWVMEPKYDGHRILIYVDGKRARIFTGGGREKTGKLPHVETAIAERFPDGTWLDGEAIALDGKTAGWGIVQSVLGSGSLHPRHREIEYACFDLLKHGDVRAFGIPLHARRDALADAWSSHESVFLVPRLEPTREQIDKLLDAGWEGVMLKNPGSLYFPGTRSREWLKVKTTATVDVVVMGFTDGNAGFTGFIGSAVFGQYKNGRLVERGRCSGMDMKTRTDMTKNKKKWTGRTIEVSYNGRVGGDAYRHPQFVRARDDKEPKECVWEM